MTNRKRRTVKNPAANWTVDKYADTIDSRDVIERIEELEGNDSPDDDEREELVALLALQQEAEGSPDWKYGEQLIRYSYFADFTQQLAEETSDQPKLFSQWPFSCIDWEYAAKELKYDYFSVDFDGVEYWIRG